MKLIDSLNQLNDDMEMIDLTETGKKVKCVLQIKKELKNPKVPKMDLT